MPAKIGKRTIGEGYPTYIVFEAGPTHTGFESAKKLALIAKEAGADAVKFQLIYADRLMADKNVMFSYKYLEKEKNGTERFIETEEPLYNILKRRELKPSEWKALKKYCDKLGITMFSTATYKDEVDFLVDELGVESIKVNSSDVNELEFVRYCAGKGINIQIDTGNADIYEIERAIIAIEESGGDNIIIHHCPSGYPARIESIHLNMIPMLIKLFPSYVVAFSDHSPGWEMDIAAVALGATMVEKTITLDRTTKSCEHSFSLESADANRFGISIRELEIARGSYRRTIPANIRNKRNMTRRSPYALKTVRAGDTIREMDFEFKRPGVGITSYDFDHFIGKKLANDIREGEVLTYEYI